MARIGLSPVLERLILQRAKLMARQPERGLSGDRVVHRVRH
jgi:hypothetical protein